MGHSKSKRAIIILQGWLEQPWKASILVFWVTRRAALGQADTVCWSFYSMWQLVCIFQEYLPEFEILLDSVGSTFSRRNGVERAVVGFDCNDFKLKLD